MRTLSIITVCLNCEFEIKKTLMSIDSQFSSTIADKIELVIVDGQSMDGTVETAKKMTEKFIYMGIPVKLSSESDSGIYDAMNKGLKMATGIWVYMLNAGDVFHPDFSLKDLLYFLDRTSADIVYGNTLRKSLSYEEEWIPGPLYMIEEGMIFCHQSVFIRRMLQEHYYDLSYKFCADYDLISRLYIGEKKFIHFNHIVSIYSLEGITAKSKMVEAYKETYSIRNKYYLRGNKLSIKTIYILGLKKRQLLQMLPDKLRWNLVKLSRIVLRKRHY